MKIARGKRVRVKVDLRAVGGEVIEKSAVEYFHGGGGGMLPALEEELEGLAPGEVKEGVIPAGRAFGAPQYRHQKKIRRGELPEGLALERGATLAAKGANGQDVVLEVLSVDGETVTTVMKHPLAESDIAFAVEVLSVSDPVPPPLPASAVADDDD